MRKSVIATVAIIVLGLIASLVWQFTHPLPPAFPTDRGLVKLFYAHRQTFETLAQMADKDAMIASRDPDESLPVARSEYSRLLSQIDSRIVFAFDPWRTTKFWCAGVGCAICPGWFKGIAHLTAVPDRVGQIVHNLDKDPGHDGVYLVPIESDWYVIYQRDDYESHGKLLGLTSR